MRDLGLNKKIAPPLHVAATWPQGTLCLSSLVMAQAHSPLAFHVGSCSVSIEHGVVRGLLHCFAVKLNGLGPLLAGKSLIGLLFHTLQVWGKFYLGAKEKHSRAEQGQGRS